MPKATARCARRPSASPTVRHTTLDDLAHVLGVSASTVSRALRADPQISLRTRERVRRAATEHNYVPNTAARSLVMRHSHTFGLLIPDLTDPVHGQLATGFEQQAAAAGYSVIIATTLRDPANERRSLEVFAGSRVDGIAVWGSFENPSDVVAAVGPSPVVFLATENPRLARSREPALVGSIRADEATGIRDLVRHLIEQDRRRFVYVGGPVAASNLVRRTAASEALDAAGLRRALTTISAGDTGWRSPAALVERIQARAPDAIICYDDKLALALIDALHAANVPVPESVAVAGFDDIPFAAISNPRLTTIAQPVEKMARRAVEMLVSAIRDRVMPPSEVLPVQLVVRESG